MEYTKLPKAPKLEPYHKIQLSVIPMTYSEECDHYVFMTEIYF